MSLPDHWRWFAEARFGMFIHWGAYAQYGRGEHVLFREHLDHGDYAAAACAWNPNACDPKQWADVAQRAGGSFSAGRCDMPGGRTRARDVYRADRQEFSARRCDVPSGDTRAREVPRAEQSIQSRRSGSA